MGFTPRLTRPEAGNKYYIRKANGGYSPAIKGKPTDPDCNVLSNCVGYAIGRFNEIGNYGSCKYLRSVNAENFIQYKDAILEVGQTPKLGAVIVWKKGATLNGSDGAGHVAIVEKIISDTQIVTSESGYGSAAFWTKTRNKGNGNWGAGSAYTFLGFIYNPAVKDEDHSTPKEDVTEVNTSGIVKVGDIVEFTGTKHYASSNALTGPACRPGKARVTATYKGRHPYHLVAVSGGGSTVYGWVNVSDIDVVKTAVPVEEEYVPQVGDIVMYNGNTHYTSAYSTTTKFCQGGLAKITAIHRPGKSKHPYHLVRISSKGATVYGWVDEGTFTEA